MFKGKKNLCDFSSRLGRHSAWLWPLPSRYTTTDLVHLQHCWGRPKPVKRTAIPSRHQDWHDCCWQHVAHRRGDLWPVNGPHWVLHRWCLESRRSWDEDSQLQQLWTGKSCSFCSFYLGIYREEESACTMTSYALSEHLSRPFLDQTKCEQSDVLVSKVSKALRCDAQRIHEKKTSCSNCAFPPISEKWWVHLLQWLAIFHHPFKFSI